MSRYTVTVSVSVPSTVVYVDPTTDAVLASQAMAAMTDWVAAQELCVKSAPKPVVAVPEPVVAVPEPVVDAPKHHSGSQPRCCGVIRSSDPTVPCKRCGKPMTAPVAKPAPKPEPMPSAARVTKRVVWSFTKWDAALGSLLRRVEDGYKPTKTDFANVLEWEPSDKDANRITDEHAELLDDVRFWLNELYPTTTK